MVGRNVYKAVCEFADDVPIAIVQDKMLDMGCPPDWVKLFDGMGLPKLRIRLQAITMSQDTLRRKLFRKKHWRKHEGICYDCGQGTNKILEFDDRMGCWRLFLCCSYNNINLCNWRKELFWNGRVAELADANQACPNKDGDFEKEDNEKSSV